RSTVFPYTTLFRSRDRQAFLHFFGGEGWELSEKCEPSFANGFAHWAVTHIGEKYEWRGGAELLALKKQWRPWPEQKQSSHRAIAPGRALKTQPFTGRSI